MRTATPRLVIACYPTMGLDVLATQAVYRELFRHAAEGACVIWISEELDELFTISDRLSVIAEGRLSPSVKPAETSIEQIGTWMSGKFGDKAAESAASRVAA